MEEQEKIDIKKHCIEWVDRFLEQGIVPQVVNPKAIKANYIPVSKIKEKIEKYKKVIEITKEQLKHEENVDVRKRLTTTIEQATAGILALEGLLRGE